MLVVHASDLHLGRPLGALPLDAIMNYDWFCHAAYRALHRLVDVCIEERPDFLLLAGDLIEGAIRDYMVGLRLVHELTRLEDTNTKVVWVRGNHDAENRVLANLLLPGHVFELGLSGVQTLRFEGCGAAVVGRSYQTRACYENLLSGYPPKAEQYCTIGVLHTSGDGQISGDSYAPCRRSELAHKGYDYFALGHVHAPTLLGPNIAYSGCLQGRNFFESGARGCLLVRFDGCRVTSVTHRSLEVVRFGLVSVDVGNACSLDQVLEAIDHATLTALARYPNRGLVVRVRLRGEAGLETLLSTNVTTRHRALRSIAERGDGRLAIDGFWADVGHDGAAWFRIDAEPTRRGDVP